MLALTLSAAISSISTSLLFKPITLALDNLLIIRLTVSTVRPKKLPMSVRDIGSENIIADSLRCALRAEIVSIKVATRCSAVF